VVENEQYLWAVVRYLELNPLLKAGLVEHAEEFQRQGPFDKDRRFRAGDVIHLA
jgi:hypothetical protein